MRREPLRRRRRPRYCVERTRASAISALRRDRWTPCAHGAAAGSAPLARRMRRDIHVGALWSGPHRRPNARAERSPARTRTNPRRGLQVNSAGGAKRSVAAGAAPTRPSATDHQVEPPRQRSERDTRIWGPTIGSDPRQAHISPQLTLKGQPKVKAGWVSQCQSAFALAASAWTHCTGKARKPFADALPPQAPTGCRVSFEVTHLAVEPLPAKDNRQTGRAVGQVSFVSVRHGSRSNGIAPARRHHQSAARNNADRRRGRRQNPKMSGTGLAEFDRPSQTRSDRGHERHPRHHRGCGPGGFHGAPVLARGVRAAAHRS